MKIRSSKSFTLIELILVVAIVFTLVVFTVPHARFFYRQQVYYELNRLFAVFSFVQYRAMASNRELFITFDTIHHTYTYLMKNNKPVTVRLPNHIRFGFFEGVKGPPANPTTIITQPVTFQTQVPVPGVRFMTNGNISPGAIYIIDKNASILCALTCPVSQVSYIRLYAYRGGRWILI